MSILRVLVLGGTIGLSTVVIGFVAIDRVAHTSFPAPVTMTVAQAPEAGPETTGTVVQGSDVAEPKQASSLDGFDTERLNALMRGELPPPPAPKPKVAKR